MASRIQESDSVKPTVDRHLVYAQLLSNGTLSHPQRLLSDYGSLHGLANPVPDSAEGYPKLIRDSLSSHPPADQRLLSD